MTEWWSDRISEVEKGERVIVMQLASKPSHGKEELSGDEEVVAVVMLELSIMQTIPFQGTVQKLLVLPEYREKGIARRMLVLLESVALREGRGLLLLDAEKGSPAELVYPRLGWVKVGEIPRFMISPLDGSLKDAVFFYKDLR